MNDEETLTQFEQDFSTLLAEAEGKPAAPPSDDARLHNLKVLLGEMKGIQESPTQQLHRRSEELRMEIANGKDRIVAMRAALKAKLDDIKGHAVRERERHEQAIANLQEDLSKERQSLSDARDRADADAKEAEKHFNEQIAAIETRIQANEAWLSVSAKDVTDG